MNVKKIIALELAGTFSECSPSQKNNDTPGKRMAKDISPSLILSGFVEPSLNMLDEASRTVQAIASKPKYEIGASAALSLKPKAASSAPKVFKMIFNYFKPTSLLLYILYRAAECLEDYVGRRRRRPRAGEACTAQVRCLETCRR